MKPERWQEIRLLVEEAFGLEPGARARLLDERCADDPALRRQAERLLRADESAGSFLEGSPVELDLGAEAPAPGTRLGRFVVLETLGVGGMGTVVAAYDPDLDRKVAVKVLRFQQAGLPLATEAARARMLREAQALGRLNHPNIITVYEVGEVEDQLFIAMELLEGCDLKAWLGSETRSWTEIRDVFVRAGRGLAAAHDAGFVHRDFKPANVWVADDGRVLVLDFGIAIFQQPTKERPSTDDRPDSDAGTDRLTRTGSIMGTPAYMAPEQLGGAEVGPQSDQFAFCVALCEALFDERPAKNGGIRLPEASAARHVPARLRPVLERGLRSEAEQRYPTMEGLLEDLAYDPWQRRRRWLTASALATISLLAGLGIYRLALDRSRLCSGANPVLETIWNEDRRREIEDAFSASGAPFATDTWNRIHLALDAYTSEWTLMRTDTCEATRLRGEQSEALMDRRIACLDGHLEEVAALTDLLSVADAGVVQRAVEAVSGLSPLSQCADAETLMAMTPLPEDPSVLQEVTRSRAELARAKALQQAARFEEAQEVTSQVLASSPAIGYWPLTAEARLRQGVLLQLEVRPEEAQESLELALLAAGSGGHDRVAAEALIHLVLVEGVQRSDPEAARRFAEHATPVIDRLEDSVALAADLEQHLGQMQFDQGAYDEARTHHRRALDLRLDRFGSQDPSVGRQYYFLGTANLEEGKLEEARNQLAESVRIAEAAFGTRHPTVARRLNSLARVSSALKKTDDALAQHQRAFEILEETLGPEHNDLATVLTSIGNLQALRGETEAAFVSFRSVQALFEKNLGPEHPHLVIPIASIAGLHFDREEYSEALAAFDRALELIVNAYGPQHPWRGKVLLNVGETLRRLGEHELAIERYRQASGVFENTLSPTHPDRAGVATGMAEASAALGRFEEAGRHARAALRIAEKSTLNPRDLGAAQFVLAQVLARQDAEYFEEAERLAMDAIENLRAGGLRSAENLAAAQRWLSSFQESKSGSAGRARPD